MTASKRILIIAGPNGAGKTTFATEFLPNEADCPTFINADLIASGLSPFKPELVAVQAAKLMLNEIYEHVRKGSRDPDLVGAEIALRRAAERVRQRAAEIGNTVVVVRDGKVVWEKADGTFDDELEDGRR